MIRKVLVIFIAVTLMLGGSVLGQDYYDVNGAMAESLKIINISDFISKGIDGAGIKIAVIDTGIDVSHPDLQNFMGVPKVIDFADFTDEGLVLTKPLEVIEGFAVIEGNSFNVKGITSRSGELHGGILTEAQLDETGTLLQDLNRNGQKNDVFGVLVSDSILPGIYDTVYVDTNMDMSFTDETPFKIYGKSLKWGDFRWKSPYTGDVTGSSFVISCIERDGSKIKISFDGNGHGTHVAGIVGARGRVTGVAPGAGIIAIKALGSSGDGTWDDIAKAVEYAKNQGADIINISVGNIATSWKEHLAQVQLMKRISRDRKTLIVMAAGNNGPGLFTATGVGGGSNVTVVGAYASASLWDMNYGAVVPGDTLLHDTGVGPNIDGTLAPTLVAPSMVTSTVPLWDTGGYYMMDGTSMAAPFVSGTAALLMQRAKAEGIAASGWEIKQALELGAGRLEGYHLLEQGNGLLNGAKAWQIIEENRAQLKQDNIAVQVPGEEGYAEGIFLKEEPPSNTVLSVTNLSNNLQDLFVTSDSPWVIPENKRLLLPRGKPSELTLGYDFPKIPGLYTAKIVGIPQLFEGSKMEFFTSTVIPYRLYDEGDLQFEAILGPSRWDRYFFKVNPGMAGLNLALSVLPEGETLGRGVMYLYDPAGRKVFEGYAGADYIEPKPELLYEVSNPAPGIWEAVVVSDYNLSHFDAETTHYQLKVNTSGPTYDGDFVALTPGWGNSNYTQEILLKNGGTDFEGKIDAVGLADLNSPFNTAPMTVRQGEFAQGPSVIITDNAMNLEIRLEAEQAVDGDIDLYLYRKNPATGQYEVAASSTKNDVMNEEVKMLMPEPGEYLVYVDGFSLPQGIANINVLWRVLSDEGHLKVSDRASLHKAGEQWKVDMEVKSPSEESDYIGYLVVMDSEGTKISYIPVKLSSIK